MSWSLMSLSPLILLTGPFWIVLLGRLGLPDWFGRVYFSYHSQVPLVLAGCWSWCALVQGWGIPQGCPLSMVFIVALYVPCCRHLEVKPQLYADNRPGALFGAARCPGCWSRCVTWQVCSS